jgi:hypothetical protein
MTSLESQLDDKILTEISRNICRQFKCKTNMFSDELLRLRCAIPDKCNLQVWGSNHELTCGSVTRIILFPVISRVNVSPTPIGSALIAGNSSGSFAKTSRDEMQPVCRSKVMKLRLASSLFGFILRQANKQNYRITITLTLSLERNMQRPQL